MRNEIVVVSATSYNQGMCLLSKCRQDKEFNNFRKKKKKKKNEEAHQPSHGTKERASKTQQSLQTGHACSPPLACCGLVLHGLISVAVNATQDSTVMLRAFAR
jgi:hypothetical protein